MYDKVAMSSGAATLATLPRTGFGTIWLILAAFALLMRAALCSASHRGRQQ
jgi:LPXTG-motif cell wall-anchored protein